MTREQIENAAWELGWQNICGKLYRSDCVEYDEERDSYKSKGKKQ